MGLELSHSLGLLPNLSSTRHSAAEFKVQRDWYVLVQQALALLQGSAESRHKYSQLEAHEKRFWISIGLPDSRGLEHINIDVASFLASGATAFLKEVNLDSDFKLVIEATAEGEMKLSLYRPKLIQSTRIRSKLEPCFEHLVPYGSGVLSVSPGGELICAGSSDGWLAIIDAESGKILRRLNGHVGDIACAKFFPSGQVVLSGGSDFRAKVFGVDGDCPVTLIGGHHRALTGLAMIGKGRYSLTSALDGKLNYWKVADETCLHTISFQEPILHMSIHDASDTGLLPPKRDTAVVPDEEADGCILAVGLAKKLVICHLASAQELVSIPADLSLSCVCHLELPGPHLHMVLGSENGEVSVVAVTKEGYSCTQIRKSNSRVSALYAVQSGFWAAYGDGTISRFNVRNEPAPNSAGPELHVSLDEEVLVSDLDPIVAMAGTKGSGGSALPDAIWVLTREGTLAKFC